MGLFSKLTGGVDTKLLQTGIPARGTIMSCAPGGTTMQVGNGIVERACEFRVQVQMDNQPAYEAVVKQRIQEIYISQIVPGGTVVAVRVDPSNAANIAIDFASEPPNVTVARDPNSQSAADVLATGTPARAIIIQTMPLNMKNPEGVDLHGFVLTVMPEGGTPYQTKVGNPTPPEALPFLYPGSNVPVKIGTEGPDAVVIDWAQAVVPPPMPPPPPN